MDANGRQQGKVAQAGTASVWKVGELAGRTGLSVRALHYYEEIGLLLPSRRTGSGHRLYSAEDVLRLQRIVSLRSLGFTLEEIRQFQKAGYDEVYVSQIGGNFEPFFDLYRKEILPTFH